VKESGVLQSRTVQQANQQTIPPTETARVCSHGIRAAQTAAKSPAHANSLSADAASPLHEAASHGNLLSDFDKDGENTMYTGPQTIDEAITDYSGFHLLDAHDMTPDDIRGYFTRANFAHMFGEDDADPDWPWSFEKLANRAIEMVQEYNDSIPAWRTGEQ
jgi:hypothetical protein